MFPPRRTSCDVVATASTHRGVSTSVDQYAYSIFAAGYFTNGRGSNLICVASAVRSM